MTVIGLPLASFEALGVRRSKMNSSHTHTLLSVSNPKLDCERLLLRLQQAGFRVTFACPGTREGFPLDNYAKIEDYRFVLEGVHSVERIQTRLQVPVGDLYLIHTANETLDYESSSLFWQVPESYREKPLLGRWLLDG